MVDEYVPPVNDDPVPSRRAFPRECPRCGGWMRGGALETPPPNSRWAWTEPPPGVDPGRGFLPEGLLLGPRLIGARCLGCGAMLVLSSG